MAVCAEGDQAAMVAPHPRRWAILRVLCIGPLMIIADTSIVSVALPGIAVDFGADAGSLAAVVDAYQVTFAGLLVCGGMLADQLGRRRSVLIGLIGFCVASVVAACAPAVAVLVVMRAVLGVCAALVVPATVAALLAVFPMNERPKAFGVWAAMAAVASAAGPVFGGALVAAFDWSAVFWVNVPVAALAVILVRRIVPESRDPGTRPVDLVAATLFTVGVGGVVFSAIAAGAASKSVGAAWTLPAVGLVIGVLALSSFVLRRWRRVDDWIDLSLYRDPAFSGVSIAAGVLALGTGSTPFLVAQYLDGVRERPPWQIGMVIAALAVGAVAGSTLGVRTATRPGARMSLLIGFAFVAAGFLGLAVVAAIGLNLGYFVAALITVGAGVGISGPSVSATVLGVVPSKRFAMGAALNSTHQQLGTTLGIALFSSAAAALFRTDLPCAVPRSDSGTLTSALGYAKSAGGSLADQVRGSFASAFALTMASASACCVVAAAIAWVALRPCERKPRY